MSARNRFLLVCLSLLLICSILPACLPGKVSGLTCSANAVVDRIKSIITPKKEVKQSQGTDASAAEPLGKPDPEWWKKQPDLKQEETAVSGVITQLGNALSSKDIDTALNYFAPGVKDTYRELFSKNAEIMPQMASDLATARINFLSLEGKRYERVAEYLITAGGKNFSIVFIKIDGKWLLETF